MSIPFTASALQAAGWLRVAIRPSILAAGVVSAGLGLGTVAVPVAPTAHADVCGSVGGRHVDVGGCTPGITGDVVAGAAAGAAVRAVDPYVPGEIPCYAPDGQPYYTPPGAPC
jgi:hypothetical protein